ncbi:MAG: amidohydrolase family protein, partial [Burkholderiales bacterium]
ALGLEAQIGSIAPGKAADLVAVRFAGPELEPSFHPVSHLVYAAGRQQVSHVWVAGRLLVRDGALQNPAFSALDTRCKLWQNTLKTRPES